MRNLCALCKVLPGKKLESRGVCEQPVSFGDPSYILPAVLVKSPSIPEPSPYSRLRGPPKLHRDVSAEDEGK